MGEKGQGKLRAVIRLSVIRLKDALCAADVSLHHEFPAVVGLRLSCQDSVVASVGYVATATREVTSIAY